MPNTEIIQKAVAGYLSQNPKLRETPKGIVKGNGQIANEAYHGISELIKIMSDTSVSPREVEGFVLSNNVGEGSGDFYEAKYPVHDNVEEYFLFALDYLGLSITEGGEWRREIDGTSQPIPVQEVIPKINIFTADYERDQRCAQVPNPLSVRREMLKDLVSNYTSETLNDLFKSESDKILPFYPDHVHYTDGMLKHLLELWNPIQDRELCLGVLKHQLWEIKRRMAGLPVKDPLFVNIRGVGQGIGKTSYFKKIAGPLVGHSNLGGSLNILTEAKNYYNLVDKFFILMDEINSEDRIKKHQLASIKFNLTTEVVEYRIFHTQSSAKGPRRAVIASTSNVPLSSIIRDHAYRRFFEMEVLATRSTSDVHNDITNFIYNEIDYVALYRGIDASLEDGYLFGDEVLLPKLHEAQRAMVPISSVDEAIMHQDTLKMPIYSEKAKELLGDAFYDNITDSGSETLFATAKAHFESLGYEVCKIVDYREELMSIDDMSITKYIPQSRELTHHFGAFGVFYMGPAETTRRDRTTQYVVTYPKDRPDLGPSEWVN